MIATRMMKIVLASTLGLVLMQTAELAASPRLRTKLKPIAQNILDLLEQDKQQAVAFAIFPPDLFTGSNSGPGIQRILIEELQALAKRKEIVQERADVVIFGTYSPFDHKDDLDRKLRFVRISIEMKNIAGKVLLNSEAIIDTAEDIIQILQAPGDFPPNANRGDLHDRIRNFSAKPSVFIDGSIIKTKKDSPYAVEILVGGKARGATDKKGHAFVEINRDEIYEIRVHNHAVHEAAVAVAIDGLDVFTFSEDRNARTGLPKFSHFIIQPNNSGMIDGWHKTSDPKRKDNVLSFLVTEYGKGAASSRKVVGKTGTITVSFAAAWIGDNRPADEGGSRTPGGNETALGPPRQRNFTAVQRTFGNIRDQIVVRYSRE